MAAQISPAEGPLARKVRDIPCLLVFVAAWIGVVALSIKIYTRDVELDRTYWPLDYYGRFCGKPAEFQSEGFSFPEARLLYNQTFDGYTVKDNPPLDMTDKEYLFWPVYTGRIDQVDDVLLHLSIDDAICVSQCPDLPAGFDYEKMDTNATMADLATYVCYPEWEAEYSGSGAVSVFTGAEAATQRAIDSSLFDKVCRIVVYDTDESAVDILYKRCLPGEIISGASNVLASAVGQLLSGDVLSTLAQIEVAIPIIVGAIIFSIFLGFVWLVLIRRFAKPFVYTLLVAFLVLLVVITIWFYNVWQHDQDIIDKLGEENVTNSTQREAFFEKCAFIGFCIVSVVYALFLLIMLPRISYALTIVIEAGHAIQDIRWAWLIPICFIFVGVVVLAFIIYSIFLVWASGDFRQIEGHREFDPSDADFPLFAGLIFFLFWNWFFLSGLCQTTVAGAIAAWYWRRDKKVRPPHAVMRSLQRACKYHLGSIALGSFFTAFLFWLAWLIRYARKKLEKSKSASGLTVKVMKILSCLLTCLGWLMNWVNKHVFIEIAVYGESYLTAAKRAIKLVSANMLRYVAIDTIGDAILFVGKLFVALLNGFIVGASVYYSGEALGASSLSRGGGYLAAALIAFMIGAFIGDQFFDVYETAVDTISLSFLEDTDRNNGTPQAPFFASHRLRKFIDIKTEAVADLGTV